MCLLVPLVLPYSTLGMKSCSVSSGLNSGFITENGHKVKITIEYAGVDCEAILILLAIELRDLTPAEEERNHK